MNGRYRFFAFRESGLVVSEKALKEVHLAWPRADRHRAVLQTSGI